MEIVCLHTETDHTDGQTDNIPLPFVEFIGTRQRELETFRKLMQAQTSLVCLLVYARDVTCMCVDVDSWSGCGRLKCCLVGTGQTDAVSISHVRNNSFPCWDPY